MSRITRRMLLPFTAFAVAALAAPDAFGSAEFYGSGGQFTFLVPLTKAPDLAIPDLDGTPRKLDAYHGKVVVLNFWATWCAPCIRELPALDRLAAKADNRIAVIAVSIDQGGTRAVMPLVEQLGLAHLEVFIDSEQKIGGMTAERVAAGALPLWALPITYLIDKDGRVVGYLPGTADWASHEAEVFLRQFAN